MITTCTRRFEHCISMSLLTAYLILESSLKPTNALHSQFVKEFVPSHFDEYKSGQAFDVARMVITDHEDIGASSVRTLHTPIMLR